MRPERIEPAAGSARAREIALDFSNALIRAIAGGSALAIRRRG